MENENNFQITLSEEQEKILEKNLEGKDDLKNTIKNFLNQVNEILENFGVKNNYSSVNMYLDNIDIGIKNLKESIFFSFSNFKKVERELLDKELKIFELLDFIKNKGKEVLEKNI